METDQVKVIKSNRGLYQLVPIKYQGTGLRISKKNKYLVYSSREGHVVVYDPKTCSTLMDVKVSDGSLWNLDISSDESLIIAGGVQNEIYLVRFPFGEILPSFTGHTSEINHCVFSSDCSSIYSASDDGKVRYFDVVSHSSEVLLDHGRIVYAFDLSSDERMIVSGDSSGQIKIVTLIDRELKECSSNNSVWCLKISPNNLLFVSGNSAGVLEVWTMTGELIKTLNSRHKDRLRCIDFGDNDEVFASTGNDHLVKVWKCDNWQEEVTFDLHSDWIKAVVFDRCNKTWNCISDDRFISIISQSKNNGGIHLDVQGEIFYMEKIGHLMVFNHEFIFVCDFLTGDVLNKIAHKGKILKICERNDGNFLICFENSVKVLNSRNLQFLPQQIEKIGCEVLLSPSYFYRISSHELDAYSSSVFTHVFSLVVNDFDLLSSKKIGFFNDRTFIGHNNVLHIFNKSDLLRSFHFESEIQDVIQIDEKRLVVILNSLTVILVKNLEISSKIKIDQDIPISLTFKDQSIFVYNKTTINEYSKKTLKQLKTITFHESLKNFQVFGKFFVVVQESGLITIHQQLNETYIVKDEDTPKLKIQKN
jgi:WD40 repeat protein